MSAAISNNPLFKRLVLAWTLAGASLLGGGAALAQETAPPAEPQTTHSTDTPDTNAALAEQALSADLKSRLLARAGKNPDAAALTRALGQEKEALQHILADGDAPQRAEASHRLELLDGVFVKTLAGIAAPKPAPRYTGKRF